MLQKIIKRIDKNIGLEVLNKSFEILKPIENISTKGKIFCFNMVYNGNPFDMIKFSRFLRELKSVIGVKSSYILNFKKGLDLFTEKEKLTILSDVINNNCEAKLEVIKTNKGFCLDFFKKNDYDNADNHLNVIKHYCNYFGIKPNEFEITYKQEFLNDEDFKVKENIKAFSTKTIDNTKFWNGVVSDLNKLPKTEEELENENIRVVQTFGEVFFVEERELTKSNLLTFKITNFSDSITCKLFLRKKSSLSIKKGEKVQVKGNLSFDHISQDVVIMVNKEEDIEYYYQDLRRNLSIDDIFDRCELHTHTTFSVQDGISSIEEYFKSAKKMGISSLAITDHENVQGFPEVEKWSKKYDIKPIYGVELNLIDENEFKIVNVRNDKSKANTFVALDIETTGFSVVCDDIIEISAIKKQNGTQMEYNVLIKYPESKLSPKITELTGLTQEMLDNEGVDIESALKGLFEFVGDSYIVAHNAKFDVDFVEYKLKSILNIDKKYNYVDTLNFSRVVLKDEMKRFNLKAVSKKLGVELVEHHRAIYDTRACLGIFEKLIERLAKTEVKDFNENDFNNCCADLKFTNRKKYLEIVELINSLEFTHIDKTVFNEQYQEEEGYFEIDCLDKKFLCDYLTINNYENLVCEIDDFLIEGNAEKIGARIKLKYNNPDDKKIFSKIKTSKGAKVNIISFQHNITQEKKSACKGTMKIKISSFQNLCNLTKNIKLSSIYVENNVTLKTIKNLVNEKNALENSIFGTHCTVLVKNQEGLKDLFKLISVSHTDLLNKKTYITKNILSKMRNNLLIGTSCTNGLFKFAFEKGMESFKEKVSFYDYVEIQPLECYKSFSTDRDVSEDILKILKEMIEYCTSKNILVVATSDAHYVREDYKEYRDIYIDTPIVGGGFHDLYGKKTGVQNLKSAKEMYEEMKKIDFELASKLTFENPNKINSLISDDIEIIKKELFTPTDDFLKDKVLDIVGYKVPSVIEEFKKLVAQSLKTYRYKGKLPKIIFDRVQKEMNSIINNGFAVIYYIAYLLVKKSNMDGYNVGSRGSVGSSFVATLIGVSEVNPLPPHYICPKCNYSIFKKTPSEKNYDTMSDEEKKLDSYLDNAESGYDLPDNYCPHCHSKMIKDGHDIPFETFLGFEGDKVPDIDLNFSGENQASAHNFCKEVFGEDHAFRAGTLSTVAEKTAQSFVNVYYNKKGVKYRRAEIERRASILEGVKRSTGQHPGGIIIVPSNKDIYDFTPYQYPANDATAEWKTTHFDFHAIHDNVLKLDILGHDNPTILKMIMDYVRQNQSKFAFSEIKDIPVDDPAVYELLRKDAFGKINSLGIPELATNFVRQMLSDTDPKNFAELVKISGLSHGTDVWLKNAKELVLGNTEFGKIDFKDVIGCRDDIMVYLLYQGLEPKMAFDIMEFVRKGQPSKNEEKWNEYSSYMRSKGVPEWYIWSCSQIKYMFPKAHATAYVLSAMRIAWFKVYAPIVFYSTYFSVKANNLDLQVILEGENAIKNRIQNIRRNTKATDKELDQADELDVVLEALEKGIKIVKPDINVSMAKEFVILDDNTLIASFMSIDGLGEQVANSIIDSRNEKNFIDLDDFLQRKLVNKTVTEFFLNNI